MVRRRLFYGGTQWRGYNPNPAAFFLLPPLPHPHHPFGYPPTLCSFRNHHLLYITTRSIPIGCDCCCSKERKNKNKTLTDGIASRVQVCCNHPLITFPQGTRNLDLTQRTAISSPSPSGSLCPLLILDDIVWPWPSPCDNCTPLYVPILCLSPC